MYNTVKFGIILKNLLLKTDDIDQITDFAINTIIKVTDIDDDVRNIAGTLALMKGNKQFEFSLEELHEIANRLIFGDQNVSKVERSNFKISLKNKKSKKILDKFKLKARSGIYTIINFGLDLKQLLLERHDPSKIGSWAYLVYSKHLGDELDPGLTQLMLDLATMEDGDEFAISDKMLNKIADDLIAGKDVDLNADEYRETDFESNYTTEAKESKP